LAIECPDTQVARSSVDYERIERIGLELLEAIGEDPNREGLVGTPRRWAGWWREFIEYDCGNVDVSFESVVTDQLVVVTGIPVWSLCEHHLLPFRCEVSVGYLTGGRVIGLSKIARVAQRYAHRLQIQERMVHQIADEIEAIVGDSTGVAVIARGVHLCMVMRGVRTPGSMVTSVMRGRFMDSAELRQEFLSLVGRNVGDVVS
jgi:GTP cyclohydrolase IA